MADITVEKLTESRKQDLDLTLLTSNRDGLKKIINNPELHRPGLALTGFYERFASKRIQILGETEATYLSQLSQDRLKEISRKMFDYGLPLVIITKGIAPPAGFIKAADSSGT